MARFAAATWLSKDDSIPDEKIVAEAWSVWKKSIGLKMKHNANLSYFMEVLWPTPHANKTECTDPVIITMFLRWLESKMLTGSEAVTQLSGFMFFVDAGLQLEANASNDRKQYYSVLASCLCALRCFCDCFDLKTVPGINWKQLAAASALRLAQICQRLNLNDETAEISQGIEQAKKELAALKKSASSANVDKIFQPIHKFREIAKSNRIGKALLWADGFIIDTYSTIGDKEKVALWQRTLATDIIEYGKLYSDTKIFEKLRNFFQSQNANIYIFAVIFVMILAWWLH